MDGLVAVEEAADAGGGGVGGVVAVVVVAKVFSLQDWKTISNVPLRCCIH